MELSTYICSKGRLAKDIQKFLSERFKIEVDLQEIESKSWGVVETGRTKIGKQFN